MEKNIKGKSIMVLEPNKYEWAGKGFKFKHSSMLGRDIKRPTTKEHPKSKLAIAVYRDDQSLSSAWNGAGVGGVCQTPSALRSYPFDIL